MKINVLFFASAKDVFRCAATDVVLEEACTVLALKQQLASQFDVPLAEVEKLRASIDQDFARDEDLVDPQQHREVALFPPVTGG
ncbi:MoaD/ThiS family protein [Maribrevibacterium harenarium]|nr:MoaD/ThiS family protein [Maribrevibacterium harenarium]